MYGKLEKPKLTYRQSSSTTKLPLVAAAYRTRIKWVKRAFQTPSLNSCKRSTTSMRGISESEPSLSTNAF
jgi:hypothetical protein